MMHSIHLETIDQNTSSESTIQTRTTETCKHIGFGSFVLLPTEIIRTSVIVFTFIPLAVFAASGYMFVNSTKKTEKIANYIENFGKDIINNLTVKSILKT